MRERLGAHCAAGLPHETVVTDRRGGSQPFFDIPRLEQRRGAVRVVRPRTSVAIGLKLEHDRQRVRIGLVAAALQLAHAVRSADKVLDVVSDLVADDVGGGEIARAAELRYLLKKLVSRYTF